MKFDSHIVGLFLLISALVIIAPAADKANLHYIILLVSIAFGLRTLLKKPGRFAQTEEVKKVYNYSRIIFIYLMILSLFYLVNMQYDDTLVQERSFLAQMNYVILYAIIFIFASNMIHDNALASKKIYNVIMAYIYIIYLWINIKYFIMNHGVAHSSYSACLGMIIYANVMDQYMNRKYNLLGNIKYSTVLVILIIMPIMGSLRGATIALMLITMSYIIAVYINKKSSIAMKKKVGIFLIFIVLGAIYILSSDTFIQVFRDTNTYSYDNPSDMMGALSEKDANREVRVSWWTDAVGIIYNSPIWGSAFQFEFRPFNSDISNASMLHSYYAAILVDTGLVVIVLYLIILIKAISIALQRVREGSTDSIKYLSWNIAVILTYATNASGHRWTVSVPLALFHSFALVKLYTLEKAHRRASNKLLCVNNCYINEHRNI